MRAVVARDGDVHSFLGDVETLAAPLEAFVPRGSLASPDCRLDRLGSHPGIDTLFHLAQAQRECGSSKNDSNAWLFEDAFCRLTPTERPLIE
jgi:hypothetical protein